MNAIILNSIFVVTASLFFVINDAIINYLSPKNIQFYHFVFYGSPVYLFVPIYLLIKGNFKEKMQTTNIYIPLLRSLLFLPMPYITFVALKNISLPEFTTLNMSSPLFASLYAILLLKEKFNLFLVFSLFSGFFGVLLVVQPGFENFNPYFLLVLVGAFVITSSTVLTNKYNTVTSSIGFFIYGGIFTHLLSFVLFFIDPLMINLNTFFLIFISSFFINTAIFLMTFAFQASQKYYSSIFCLVYIQILWSMIIGYFIFSEYLNLYAFIGAIFIVFSGILSIPSQYKQHKSL
tara:strand:+ start:1020 stop:1892 length:873 start_codon:yes stop_codon:yes gene_type:complete